MMIENEDKFREMSGEEVKDIVQAAMQGMSQVKEEKQREIIKNLREMLDKEQVAIEVVNNFEKMLERNGASLPDEILEYRDEAKQFSRELAKKLGKKLKLSELEDEYEKSKDLKIYTHKIAKLKHIVEKGQEWMTEAKATVDQEVQLADLSKLIADARKMNIELDLFEDIKNRQNSATSLISQSESTVTVTESRKTRSKQKRTTKKKIDKEEALSIFNQLKELKVLSPKIDSLKEHLDEIEKWEKLSNDLLEKPSASIDLSELETLIEEAKNFRYVVKAVATVQEKLDMLEWKEDVKQTLEELQSKPEEEVDAEMKDEEQVSPTKRKSKKSGISLEDINGLISEGKKNGFSDCHEMKQLTQFLDKVNLYKAKVLEIFEVMDSDESEEEESEIEGSKKSQSESVVRSKTESTKAQSDANWNKKSYYKDK